MKYKHIGLVLATSFSLLTLGALSIRGNNSNTILANVNKGDVYTLTIDSSSCDLFKKGDSSSSGLAYTALNNPIRLNKTKSKNDMELVNDKDSLLLIGSKNYYSSIEIDESTPFYSLVSIKVDFEVPLNGGNQSNHRVTLITYSDASSKFETTLVSGVRTSLSSKNHRYFSIRTFSIGTGEYLFYINSIVVEYMCIN